MNEIAEFFKTDSGQFVLIIILVIFMNSFSTTNVDGIEKELKKIREELEKLRRGSRS